MFPPNLVISSNKLLKEAKVEAPLLKVLREKKKFSRTKISKLTQLTTYQVEGLEGKTTENLLSRTFLYINALGYNVNDVLRMIDLGEKRSIFPKGTLTNPRSETNFGEGVKFLTYFYENGSLFGQLQLAVGKNLGRENFQAADMVLGIVREGTLVIDMIAKQTVHKKDHFFVLPGNTPVDFLNGDSFTQVSALLFSVKFPR